VIAVGARATAADRYDPRLKFRTLSTTRFDIYFHQGEEPLARRLAAIAEEVAGRLASQLGRPAGRVHVILVDQTDVSNGWATPVPYNLIEIAAIPPPPSTFLGHHDDWLRIVLTHEYAHILHLDRVGGVMTGLRWVLGRSPATFPNLFVPQWQVEGFATWAESAVTGFGRVRAADVAAAVSRTAAAGRATIDRAAGGLVAWPSGNTPYFEGGLFDEAIAKRFSPKALGDLTQDTARRIPFLGGPAHRKVTGKPVGVLWREVFAAPADSAPASGGGFTRLTHDGFAVSGPRIVRQTASPEAGPGRVFYSSQGPHRFPDIRMVGLAGGPSEHVASRFDGQTLSSEGGWLFYDQLEFDGAAAIVSDLYARDLESGRVTRLSRRQRLTDPDIDATGSRLIAVRARDGRKLLAVWRVERAADGRPALPREPQHVIGRPECQYASPRWSPDGARIAAVRQCPGSLPEIVGVAVADGTERVLASGGRNVTPAWLPDGQTVLFASDREEGRFRLYAVAAASDAAGPPVLVLDAAGVALWPDVAADGRTVVFTSLTADGYDVFTAALPGRAAALSGRPAAPASAAAPMPADETALGSQPLPAGEYSPWRTLLPRSWSPLLNVSGDDVDVGASTGAADALGYHQYSASVLWRASGLDADFSFDGPPVGWTVSYAYNRWRPSLLLSAWSSFDTVLVAADGLSRVLVSEERSQGVFAGVYVPRRRVRLAQSWLAGVDLDLRSLPAWTGIANRARNGARAGWSVNSSRQYGYSISPEDGTWAAVNVERVTTGLGADGNATSLTGDWRAYLPGLGGHQVTALRVGAASSTGDRGMRRAFDLGGSGVPASPFSLGERVVGLLRGLPPDDREGTAVLVANLDYRFPLARVERGVGNWPAFLRDLHGAVFADVGSAGPAMDQLPAAVWSLGGELAARITLGYTWNLTLAAGAAWVRDPARADQRDRVAVFVRTGYAF
jgi:hypothetical protein